MSEEALREREGRIASMIGTHFSRDGVSQQIGLFLQGKGDLRCHQLPKNGPR